MGPNPAYSENKGRKKVQMALCANGNVFLSLQINKINIVLFHPLQNYNNNEDHMSFWFSGYDQLWLVLCRFG